MDIFQSIAGGFNGIGLQTPLSRFIALGAVGGALEYTLKPSFSYNKDGSMRPWILFSKTEDATYLPAGSIAFILAVWGGLFN